MISRDRVENTTFGLCAFCDLRDQAHLFSDLNGLSTAFGAEFVEEMAGVGLDCVLADKELFRDLAVAHALRHQLENFEFTFSNAEVLQALFIYREGL